jgi:hypothetical protein
VLQEYRDGHMYSEFKKKGMGEQLPKKKATG